MHARDVVGEIAYVVVEVVAGENVVSCEACLGDRCAHQEKSHVFIHFAWWHFAFVHGRPYAIGLKYE